MGLAKAGGTSLQFFEFVKLMLDEMGYFKKRTYSKIGLLPIYFKNWTYFKNELNSKIGLFQKLK